MIGHGPVPKPDTPQAFLNFTELFAKARIASTPLGYKLVASALDTSVSGVAYQGVSFLTQYNPDLCANQCDTNDDCSAFNICKWLLLVFWQAQTEIIGGLPLNRRL
jgi:hypothetical protein